MKMVNLQCFVKMNMKIRLKFTIYKSYRNKKKGEYRKGLIAHVDLSHLSFKGTDKIQTATATITDVKIVNIGMTKPNLPLFKTFFQKNSRHSKKIQTIRPFFLVFASSGLSPCFVPFLGEYSQKNFHVLTFLSKNVMFFFFKTFK